MKETINYPIFLFEEPILIPKIHEEAKELLSKIEIILDKCETSRKIKSKAYNLCCEYFQTNFKLELNATFNLSFLEKNDVKLEFIFNDKEGEFVKQLRKYNQVFKEKGFLEFKTLYKGVLVKNKLYSSERKFSVEDNVIIMLYSHFWNNKYIFKEEITKEDKFKITYQIRNKV
ncbi:hypothetical protein V9L05_12780 [Bernardetia sp. Wsw4-3y2]|uniref:hypothetical protein n=1 Tax=Bernardetia sp. Wsw4-3y2 TaxID=3127471 RepID=UPI0030D4E8C7